MGWPTKLVVVVPSLDGNLTGKLARVRNSSNLTYIVYQRQDPGAARYSPNFGFEGGVHVQFVHDEYEDLPEVTAFLQDRAEQHNPNIEQWLGCLREDMAYAPLTGVRLLRRGLDVWRDQVGGRDAIVEQCWRNMLAAFDLSGLLPPRAKPTVGYYQGALFAASRAQLRLHPRSAYARAHALLAGGDGRCHHGELQWETLFSPRLPTTVALDAPANCKHTSAGAWEHLEHIIVGGMGRNRSLRAPYKFDFCSAYRADCPGTPCSRRAAARVHGPNRGQNRTLQTRTREQQ